MLGSTSHFALGVDGNRFGVVRLCGQFVDNHIIRRQQSSQIPSQRSQERLTALHPDTLGDELQRIHSLALLDFLA